MNKMIVGMFFICIVTGLSGCNSEEDNSSAKYTPATDVETKQ